MTERDSMAAPLGLVLSGGGARGAYEVGVLMYLAKEFPGLLERIRIIAGSSVGAVNAAFLAGHGLDPRAVEHLAELWRSLRLDDALAIAPLSALRLLGAAAPLPFWRLGQTRASGLIDASGLWRIVAKQTPWSQIHEHVSSGRLDAVAVAATDIACGETHVFVDAAPHLRINTELAHDEFVFVPTELSFRHVLASASLPLLFPPVEISRRWYMDGGVRHNTPLSPALELGAAGLVVINVQEPERADISAVSDYPEIGQMLGKLLDAMFHDRVHLDLDRLRRINDVVDAIEAVGPDVARRIREELVARNRHPYRKVPYAYVHPERDLGAIAVRELQRREGGHGVTSIRNLTSLFDDGDSASGELSSFLFFDGAFTSKLIDRGMEDAANRRDDLRAL